MEDIERPAKPFNVNWLNTAFLLGTPPLALVGAIWHGLAYGITWVEGMICCVWYFACGLSITVGYHRLFTHRSHDARAPSASPTRCSAPARSRIPSSSGRATIVVITRRSTMRRTRTMRRADSGGVISSGS